MYVYKIDPLIFFCQICWQVQHAGKNAGDPPKIEAKIGSKFLLFLDSQIDRAHKMSEKLLETFEPLGFIRQSKSMLANGNVSLHG